MMSMRWSPVLVRAGAAVALVLALAACTPGGQFDPTTIFSNDMFDNKKKLTGDRAPVFPNGVPGTATGVPADLVKGYQAPPDQSADANAVPDAAANQAAKPKPVAAEPKPKPKPKVARAPAGPPPTRININPSAPAAAPPPGAAASQSQSPWPASPSNAPAQQAAQPSQSVWPNPPAPGTKSQ
jgi:hypothetical protein